jgi:predicted molibdopterin-dependent oxidoreductase YjgC
MNLANLAMVTGHVGKEFAGVNPLRGQNNVQGACDMGALPNTLPGYAPVTDPSHIERFEKAWGVTLNREVGLRIPEMLEEAVAGELKAMYVMGEDPVLTDADANHVRKAMDTLDFLVVQDLFMTETAKYADVFLPAACYAEKDGTFTNTERRVQRVRKAIEPPGECREDWRIVADLSARMGRPMSYANVEEVFEEIRSLTPQYAGITYSRIDKAGLQWPVPDEQHPGTTFLHKDRFARGKGKLSGIPYEPPAELLTSEYPMLLTTGRMLFHYNVMTRHSGALDGLRPYELIEINPEDAARLELEEGDEVAISSRRGSIVARATITDRVPPNTAFMTFHYHESPVNELTNSAYDPVTKTAEFKVTAVRIEKLVPCAVPEEAAALEACP